MNLTYGLVLAAFAVFLIVRPSRMAVGIGAAMTVIALMALIAIG